MASKFFDKSCLVLQQNDFLPKRHTHFPLRDIACIDKNEYGLIKYNLSSVIALVIHNHVL